MKKDSIDTRVSTRRGNCVPLLQFRTNLESRSFPVDDRRWEKVRGKNKSKAKKEEEEEDSVTFIFPPSSLLSWIQRIMESWSAKEEIMGQWKLMAFRWSPLSTLPGISGREGKKRRRTEAKRKWSAQDGARSFNHVIFTRLAFFFFFFSSNHLFSLSPPSPPWWHFPLHLLYSPHRSATIRRTEIQYRFHQAVDSGRFFQSNSQILFLLPPIPFRLPPMESKSKFPLWL